MVQLFRFRVQSLSVGKYYTTGMHSCLYVPLQIRKFQNSFYSFSIKQQSWKKKLAVRLSKIH